MDDFLSSAPSCVLVEFIPTQVFSDLDKALEFTDQHNLTSEVVAITEVYFTPMGTVTRDVNEEAVDDT